MRFNVCFDRRGFFAKAGWRHLQPRKGFGLVGHALYAACHGVCHLELEGIGHITHVEVHTLQRCQRHLLYFQRLNGGFQRGGVLVQPELH